MGDHGGVTRGVGHGDGLQGLGEGADLVDLDEDGVTDALVDAFLEDPGVGDEQVVAHQLHLVAQAFGETLPPRPVALRQAVLDAEDGVLGAPVRQQVDHAVGVELATLALQVVDTVLVKLGAGHVQTQIDVAAQLEAGLVDGGDDGLHRRLVGAEVRGEAALVAHRRGQAALMQHRLEGMEDLGAVAHRLAQAGGAHRQDHEFLEVDAVVRVLAAIDDVHHRDGQPVMALAEIAVQGQGPLLGGGVGHGHGDAEEGVGAEAALVVGAVQLDHAPVDAALV